MLSKKKGKKDLARCAFKIKWITFIVYVLNTALLPEWTVNIAVLMDDLFFYWLHVFIAAITFCMAGSFFTLAWVWLSAESCSEMGGHLGGFQRWCVCGGGECVGREGDGQGCMWGTVGVRGKRRGLRVNPAQGTPASVTGRMASQLINKLTGRTWKTWFPPANLYGLELWAMY